MKIGLLNIQRDLGKKPNLGFGESFGSIPAVFFGHMAEQFLNPKDCSRLTRVNKYFSKFEPIPGILVRLSSINLLRARIDGNIAERIVEYGFGRRPVYVVNLYNPYVPPSIEVSSFDQRFERVRSAVKILMRSVSLGQLDDLVANRYGVVVAPKASAAWLIIKTAARVGVEDPIRLGEQERLKLQSAIDLISKSVHGDSLYPFFAFIIVYLLLLYMIKVDFN